MQQTYTTVSKTIPAGSKWSGVIQRGKTITFTATSNNANVSLLLFNAHDGAERYNMPDSLKAQYTAFLTTNNVLMSDQGRVLASIIDDDIGWHDTIGGYITAAQVTEKFGETNYQLQRNKRYTNGEDNLLIELFRNGLSRRDLGPVVNLFSKVVCEEDGRLTFVEQVQPGQRVTLRTEMDVLLVLSNTPHPLTTITDYPTSAVTIDIADAAPAEKLDPAVQHRGENERAFENTWEYVQLTKGSDV